MALIGSSNSLGGLAGSNAIARLLVVVSGDSSQLTTALASAEGKMTGFAANAGAIGSALTRTVTLPFLAIGGAAVKAATDFNYAVTKVAALTPVLDDTGQSAEQLSQSLIDMANDPRIVASPTDLANALYFAGSAGLKAADAMEVVRLSAEGQSVGMGDAADISKVLIAAMNNYGPAALSASDAMDALTVAIREGTAEPEDMAVALGRLLPVAEQAGVSFQEVVASVAALTNLGVPARVATTSLRALFGGLLAPTQAAAEQLDALGISADQLRYKLQQGPIEAFKLLSDATKGNFDELRQLIPQIRAITAYYGLSGQRLREYKGIIEDTTNSQGALQRVLDQFVNTPTFKFQKAVQQLQIAGIELGNQLLPVFNQLVGILTDLAQGFSALPGPAKAAFAALLTVGSAIGPLLKLYSVITQFGTGGVAAFKGFAAGATTAGLAALTAYSGFQSLLRGSQSLVSIGSALVGTIVAIQLALRALTLTAAAGKLGVGGVAQALAGIGGPQVTAIAVGIGLIATAIAIFAGRAERARQAAIQFGDALKKGATTGEIFRDTIQGITDTNLREFILNLTKLKTGLLDLPTSQALPKLQGDIGSGFLSNLTALNDELKANGHSGDDFAGILFKVQSAMQTAGGDAAKMTKLFYESGGSTKEFADAVAAAAATEHGEFASVTGVLAASVNDYSLALQNARGAIAAYDDQQFALIEGTVANDKAIQSLADQYGVSVDFIKTGLDQFGVSAFGMSNKTQDAWAKAYFGVKKNGDLIQGKTAETRDAIAQDMADMADAIQGAFGIFEELPKDTTKAMDVYLARIQDANDATVGLQADIATLSRRGVSGDLISRLLEEDPHLVSKFADATESELKRYVRAFEVNMELGDAAVLKERGHLETKAKGNITAFANATLASGKILPGVAQGIVKKMTDAFTAGSLKPAAFGLMVTFVEGLDSAKGLTKEQGSKLAVAFQNQLLNKHNWSDDGRLLTTRVAEGISRATGVPVAKVNDLMGRIIQQMLTPAQKAEIERRGRIAAQALAAGIKNQWPIAQQAGAGLINHVIQGIRSSEDNAADAMHKIGITLRNAMDSGLKNSPEYFTFYMGQKLATDLQKGFEGQRIELRAPKLTGLEKFDGRKSHFGGEYNRHTRRRDKQPINVHISRRRAAEEMTVDYDYRGD